MKPKKVQKRTKKPTFKDAQKYLRAFFATSDDCRELWAVLSALRGPDNGDEYEKDATTAVIREAFLGEKVRQFPADFAEDSEERAKMRVKMDDNPTYSHFKSHAEGAFSVLGLSWTKRNPPKKG